MPFSTYQVPTPERNAEGAPRRVGLELEIGGMGLEPTLSLLAEQLGGTLDVQSRTVGHVRGTRYGDFKVEFDHSMLRSQSYLHTLQRLGLIESTESAAADQIERSVLQLATDIVPIEIVTPPIEVSRLHELDPVWHALRSAGATGTYGSLLSAFGLHINAELADGRAASILALLRAFFLLEDWLVEVSKIDISRRIAPFIHAFPEAYRRKVLEPAYAPSDAELVADYGEHNPTRNRPLDLWPLFVHLHGPEVAEDVEEFALVKPRPAYHYRLPNCEIEKPGWTPARDFNRWVLIERLASEPAWLHELSLAYLSTLDLPLRLQRRSWADDVRARLDLPDAP